MTSYTVLNLLSNLDNHKEYYDFIYTDLKKIVERGEHRGHTQVRFVSRSLRGKQDKQFRHVFLEFQKSPNKSFSQKNPWKQVYVSEHNPVWARSSNNCNNNMPQTQWKDEISIQLPNVSHDMHEIIEHERGFSRMYVPGMRDCRHHVSDMLSFCYPEILVNESTEHEAESD
jgi:hypothetical protein